MKRKLLLLVLVTLPIFLINWTVAFGETGHTAELYSNYLSHTVEVSGDGISNPGSYTVAEIEKMEEGHFSAEYTMQTLVEPHNSVYKGIRLKVLLEKAGLMDNAKSVKITSGDGVSMDFTLSEIVREDYINQRGDKNLPVILAFFKDNTPLVPDKKSPGFVSDKGNDGGPFRLVVGQSSANERNSPKWLQNVVKIVVQSSDMVVRYSDIGNMFSWASGAIYALSENGVVSGMGDNRFEPEREVSRAEFSAMIVRAFNIGIVSPYSGKFADVKSGEWYADYVEAVTKEGILSGLSDKEFSPDGKLTRNQTALIMANIMGTDIVSASSARNTLEFKDKAKIPDWCVSSVLVCEELNIFDNIAMGYFNGDAAINRAEAAVIIHRVMKLLSK